MVRFFLSFFMVKSIFIKINIPNFILLYLNKVKMGKKHKKSKTLIHKEMTKKKNTKKNSENYNTTNSEISSEQQNKNTYPNDVQSLFERLGIE